MTTGINGVIYDLDGTVIETKELHEQGWIHASKKYQAKITDEMLVNQKGMGGLEAAVMMLGKERASLAPEFLRAKQIYVRNNIGEIKIYDGFLEISRSLQKLGAKVWICTSALEDFINLVYSRLPELSHFREKTVYKEMYMKPKPDPESLLLTVEKMDLGKGQCCYIGDAYADYGAAANAGMNFFYFCPEDSTPDSRIPSNVPMIRRHSDFLLTATVNH